METCILHLQEGTSLGGGYKDLKDSLRAESEPCRARGAMRVDSPQKCSFSGQPHTPPGFWVTLTKRKPIITTVEFPPHQARWELRVGTELISEAFLALWGWWTDIHMST